MLEFKTTLFRENAENCLKHLKILKSPFCSPASFRVALVQLCSLVVCTVAIYCNVHFGK